MWIIPKNHQLYYLYAPATVDSKEELSELSGQLESSLMWRSKPSQLRTWLTRWKRVEWFRHLCGRTLKPSQWNSFETRLTSLLEATHVSPSQRQESGSETKTQGTSGPTSDRSLEKSGRECASLRMLKDIFPKDSTQFSAIWKKTVIQHRGEYSRRLKLAHRTRGKEYLSWATPNAGDGKAGMSTGRKQKSLGQDVTVAGQQDQGRSNTNGKNRESANWATPNTMDHLALRSEEALTRQATGQRKGRSNPGNLREQVDPTSCKVYAEQKNWGTPSLSMTAGKSKKENCRSGREGYGHVGNHLLRQTGNVGKLNPAWVESLMNVPPGWTQLSGATDPHENRIDRLRLLGNGCIPAQVEKAFRTLLK